MRISSVRPRRPIALLTTLVLVAAGVVGVAGTSSASADPGPILLRDPTNVTADPLPTAQIDGVVWSQAIVGTGTNATVYAGGSFANARPAGVALGGAGSVTRNNLLSYNLSTGVLNSSFVPNLNGQVKAVAASPDGSRIYVGGSFTTANGANRYRIAAYNTSDGSLVSTFAPILSTQVNAIVATNTTVYVGGEFTSANGSTRNRLAAFSASNGALLGWNPNADYNVNAMVLSPDGTRVIVGGAFQNVGGQPEYGLAAVDATSGASAAVGGEPERPGRRNQRCDREPEH